MSNPTRSHQDQDRIKGLATTWWQLELKIAMEALAQAEHEKKVSEMRELQQKVTIALADFQVTRGAFAIPIGHGVLIVRNMHSCLSYYSGRTVEWYPDETAACLPDRVVNSEGNDNLPFMDKLNQAAAALDEQNRQEASGIQS